ncbi:DUF6090 family protein [Winogradskyella maritima]|uniref:DUF6090 family protein n=1 Tax=Winogradskyella maritima TaxID=1517766 RepID=A0ABV8AKB1_9FLAO|nr:DUF6090 family protein [Winogradskyella maritima]
MIKFFRQIRQNMIHQNRTKKYLLYAIGEIILVVIGILIALQINNWNSNKQELKVLNGYLHNIAENIKTDKINLKRIKSFRDSSIIGSRFFIEMMDTAPVDLEDARVYFSKYLKYSPLFKEKFKSNLSGFESLKNSGFLPRIQDSKIETELFKYYSLVSDINDEEGELNDLMKEMVYDLYKNNVMQELNILRRKITLSQLNHEEVERLNANLSHPSFFASNSRNRGANYLIKLYDELEETGTVIINEINLRSND